MTFEVQLHQGSLGHPLHGDRRFCEWGLSSSSEPQLSFCIADSQTADIMARPHVPDRTHVSEACPIPTSCNSYECEVALAQIFNSVSQG